MEQFEEFDAIVKIRSGGKFVPLIDRLRLQGQKVRVLVAWPIEDDETSIYQGEFACQIFAPDRESFLRGWIASGDLIRIN